MLSEADVDFLERRLHQLIVKCMGKYHMTAAMVKRIARSKASVKAIQLAFRKRRIFFRKMREKPLLTEEDVKARFAFAKRYRHKTAGWWTKAFHAAIDGKLFKVYLNGKERIRAAMHATYGACRQPGKGLNQAYVKPKGKLHRNTGAKGCLIQAAVEKGRVMMWHQVEGVWNGKAAEALYTGALKTVLHQNYPNKCSHVVLEDNDPTGYNSSAGEAAKRASNIQVFEIPCRSPDLNPLDYAIWAEVRPLLAEPAEG